MFIQFDNMCYNKNVGFIKRNVLGFFGIIAVMLALPYFNEIFLETSCTLKPFIPRNLIFSALLVILYFSHYYLFRMIFRFKNEKARPHFYHIIWKTIAGLTAISFYSFVVLQMNYSLGTIYSMNGSPGNLFHPYSLGFFDLGLALYGLFMLAYFFLVFFVFFPELFYRCMQTNPQQ